MENPDRDRGDEAAACFEDLKPEVRSYLSPKLQNAQDVEDVLQETAMSFVKAYTLQKPDVPIALAKAIAGRRLIDFLRKKRRTVSVTTNIAEGCDPAAPHQRIDLDISETVQRVLTPEEYQVFQLFRAGHSHAEIAAKLGVSLPTARSRVRNMLKKLRDRVGGGAEDE